MSASDNYTVHRLGRRYAIVCNRCHDVVADARTMWGVRRLLRGLNREFPDE